MFKQLENGLRRVFEKNSRHFSENGKLHKLRPLFEAVETIFFIPAIPAEKAPFVRDGIDLKRFMSIVLLALVPPLFFGIYNTGYQSVAASGGELRFFDIITSGLFTVMPLIIVSYVAGFFWEILFSVIRRHPISEGFLVTGLLYPMTLPPTMPLWQVAVGISFGVVIGKEVFGGTGRNIFNPALTARAFVFSPIRPDVRRRGLGGGPGCRNRCRYRRNAPCHDYADRFFSDPGSHAAGCRIYPDPPVRGKLSGQCGRHFRALLSGRGFAADYHRGCQLSRHDRRDRRAARYQFFDRHFQQRAPESLGERESVVSSGRRRIYVRHCLYGNRSGVRSGHYHLEMVYGFLIGMLTVLIRVFNPAFPEGVMMAILFMNLFAPLFDFIEIRLHVAKRIPNV